MVAKREDEAGPVANPRRTGWKLAAKVRVVSEFARSAAVSRAPRDQLQQ